MRMWCFLFLLLAACRPDRTVNTSFYYWKTIYKHNTTEQDYLRKLHVKQLYVRIMDVDADIESRQPVPISPIQFKDSLPAQVQIVPVVFIVNNVLRDVKKPALAMLALRIANFVEGKVKQSGKHNFDEIQIDCDWTASTRNNYFYLLNQLKTQPSVHGKRLSVTLRLHQLKNLKKCGVPPVSRTLLMCYNMGNLRLYGRQNSILDLSELKKYAEKALHNYPLKTDFGLPLFEWAVIFRGKQYIGISRRLDLHALSKTGDFKPMGAHFYMALNNLPQYGLLKNDEVRWENVTDQDLQATSKYLSSQFKNDTANIVYYHLDQNLLKTYPHESLEKINNLWR